MGTGILKLGPDQYVEWSTVVDAPVSYILTRKKMEAFLLAEAVKKARDRVTERLDTADRNGLTFVDCGSVAELVRGNRAGPNETELTLEQIVEKYRFPK